MKLLAAAMLALLLPLTSLAQADPPLDGRLKKIRDSKTIRVAFRTDARPFAFMERAQAGGYSVELCTGVVKDIERQLGVGEIKVQWVPVNVQDRFEAVAKGRADMECGSSTVTLGRMKAVDFSNYIFIDGTGLLVKASNAAYNLGDLAGKKIGVIAGTSNEKAVAEALKARSLSASVVTVTSGDEGLAKLESGEIDAYASDRVLLIGLAARSKDQNSLALLTDALSFEPYAITLPRGDWQMRLAVNTALARIYRSGAIGELFGRWFGVIGRPGALTEATYRFGALAD